MNRGEYISGIILVLIGTLLIHLSPVVQKGALNSMREVSFSRFFSSLKMILCDRKWLLGFSLGMAGGIPYYVAMMLVGPAVVQPLLSFGYIVLVIAARMILKERLSFQALAAIVMMMAMPVCIYFADLSNIAPIINIRNGLIPLAVFTSIDLLIVSIYWIFSKDSPVLWAPISGMLFSLGAIYLTTVLALIGSAGYDLPGDIASLPRALLYDRTLLLALLVWAFSMSLNILGTFTMQVGLQKIPASTFIPIIQTLNNAMTIIGSLAVFRQRAGNWGFYGAGILLALAGTAILSRYQGSFRSFPGPGPGKK